MEAVLDAVVRILKQKGPHAVTTNRIARVAGVSVGSLYQYFPDKRAIFVALHDRHVQRMGDLLERALVAHAGAPLPRLLRALLDALIDGHMPDPELYQLLTAELPAHVSGSPPLEERLRRALLLALSGTQRRTSSANLDKKLFVATHMLDALAHAAVMQRPRSLSLTAAKEEIVRALLACLGSQGEAQRR